MRMQHYAIFLRGFNYDVKYKRSEQNGNADGLSRLPVPNCDENVDVVNVFHFDTLDTLSLNVFKIKEAIANDSVISRVMTALIQGHRLNAKDIWNINPREFSVENGVLVRNHRVVVPTSLRAKILSELHSGHFGIVKMKSLARSYCWWPSIDRDIEHLANDCPNCLLNLNNPVKVTKHVWEPAVTPFERVHVDFAVDAFFKWPEIHIVKDMLAENTVSICREIFANFGLSENLVSGNGKTFVSNTFEDFLKENGILHKFSAPYHPATNGQAERYVQMIKAALKKMNDPKNIHNDVQKILFQYRNMVHPHTGKTPAELFLGRKLRCKLDLLKPSVEVRSFNSVNDNLKVKRFYVGQNVIARNYIGKQKRVFGKIKAVTGKLNYCIQLEDGSVWRRHVDQIRSAKNMRNSSAFEKADDDDWDFYIPPEERLILGASTVEPVAQNESFVNADVPDFSDGPSTSSPNDPVVYLPLFFDNQSEKSHASHEVVEITSDESEVSPEVVNRPKRNVKAPDLYGNPVKNISELGLSDID
ncbi:uncharacterized protein K02A2.6-like [Agrilus planipennis]|uniref:RNA-directed DNA polymerase n=1 Tax=Agrilus planipennis TaxID=224129 RepID=A0A1W4WZ11_AGRPL|nr:uncharacterized protein K02A2.6-like [Agrilus planipennis]